MKKTKTKVQKVYYLKAPDFVGDWYATFDIMIGWAEDPSVQFAYPFGVKKMAFAFRDMLSEGESDMCEYKVVSRKVKDN